MNRDNLKLFSIYDICRKIVVILIVPFFIISLLSGIILLNSKLHNNIPSLFGNYVITMPDDNFAIEDSNKFCKGSKVMFKMQTTKQYKIGDLIAFYILPDDDKAQNVTGPYWDTGNAGPTTPIANRTVGGMVQSSPFENEKKLTYAIGKIANTGHLIINETKEEIAIYSIYTSEGDICDTDNPYNEYGFISVDDIIGVATSAPGFFVSFIDFNASLDGFLFMVLLPSVILLGFSIIASLAGSIFDTKQKLINKQLFIEEESKKEKEFKKSMSDNSSYFNTMLNKKAPPRPAPKGPPPRKTPPPPPPKR